MRAVGPFPRLSFLVLLVVAAFPLASRVHAGTSSFPGVRILVVRTEAEARDAVAAYHAGVPFDRLVRDRSIGPERERGGYLGPVNPSSQPPEARAALARTPRGHVSPIFRTPDGFAVIQVVTTREERELEARARQEPEAWDLLKRGTELGKSGDLEGAVSLLQRAVEMDPDLTDAHFNLAIAQWKLRWLDVAIAAMRRVVELRPDDFEAHARLGGWLFERREYLKASEAYERAAALQMDSQETWAKLAQSYEAAGKARAAAAAYQRAISLLGRDDPDLYGGLLRAALQARDGPAAVSAAQKLRAFRTGHDGFLALGEALLLNGQAEAAIQEYARAAALAPSSAAAQAGLGLAYAQAGQTEAGVERLLRAAQLAPENPNHYRSLARLYEGLGRLDLAIVALRDGVSTAATSPELQAELAEELARLYDRAGMSREAERERDRAKSLRAP